MIYKHLKFEGVNQWVAPLLKKENQGKESQLEFLSKVLGNDNHAFPTYVEKRIAGESGSAYESEQGKLPSIVGPYKQRVIEVTEGHMYLMPSKDALALYDAWKEIPYEDASASSLWGAITLSEIRKGIIQPIWMHVDNKCDAQKAKEELDTVIRSGDNKKIDKSVRRVLRWMLAPGHMRGGAELYGNCCLAKAWWLGYLATKCAEISGIDREKIANSLHLMWLEAADYISGTLTVVSEPRVLSGLSLWASNTLTENEDANIRRTDTRKAIHSLGKFSSWSAAGLMDPEIIKDKISAVLENVTSKEQ